MNPMKFRKIVTVGINESALDGKYWARMDSLAEKRVSLPKDSAEIQNQIADADCLLVNPFSFKVEKELMDSAPGLRYIGVLSTAYAKVDYEYASKKGITVCNIPGYSTESVAEFVFAVILERLRSLEEGKRKAREGNYSEEGFSATELKGKIFGVVGAGRIGSRVAQIAKGFGCYVKYWSMNRKKQLEADGTEYENIDKLISEADILSLHLAQTKETEGFLNAGRISKFKVGAIVVNTAPMELVDTKALEDRLGRGDLTFILDHSDEMSSGDLQALSRFGNCVIYPPIGFISDEARIAKQDIFVSDIEAFLEGKPQNKIN